SYLVVENLNSGRFGKNVVISPQTLSSEQLVATKQLYDTLTRKGIYCGDCHSGNLFYFKDEHGVLRAGILDHDLIAKANEIGKLPDEWQTHAFAQVFGKSAIGQSLLTRAMSGTPVTAQELNGAMYDQKILGLKN